ncbi:MAG: PstS family phosphate ABC transporter substrate-binding protein [Metamycoplasmataceae bacterium]
MKKKKTIFLSIIGAISIGLIVFFSISWKNVETINIAGSSAVQPLIAKISNIYEKSDVVTQAGGSGAGINAVAKSTKDIGMASKNPNIITGNDDKDKQNSLYEEWINKKIKTITIAWDGMGVIYKPNDKNDKILDINQNNIVKLFKAFAGYEEFTFNDLNEDLPKQKINPYARSGGGNISGTADAFFKDSHFQIDKNNDFEKREIEALEVGNYGPNTKTTNESNSQVFNFVKDLGPGTITYLSAGYILNNYDIIIANGFQIATYNGHKINDKNITKGYDWYRPLNLMIATQDYEKNKFNKNINFINDILDIDLENENSTPGIADTKIEKLIEEEGYILLTKEQILSMAQDGKLENFWISYDHLLKFNGAKNE